MTFDEKLLAAAAAVERRDFEAAAGSYAEAIPLDPSAGLIVQYGHMLKEAGHLRSAVGAYKAAVRWDGTAGDAHVHLGHLLKRLGRIDEAIDVFMTAERIPYGPHVRPEINGLVVAKLNGKHAGRPGDGVDLKPLPEPLRRQDDRLRSWLHAEDFARGQRWPQIRATLNVQRITERRPVALRLEPMADLVIEEGSYRATTSNPRMRFLPEGVVQMSMLAGRWVDISLSVAGPETVVDPILLVENAVGWANFTATRLLQTQGDRYSTLVKLPETFVSLRLDPVHAPGRFSLGDLRVTLCPDLSPIGRMMNQPGQPLLGALLQRVRGGDDNATPQSGPATMADDYAHWMALHERPSQSAQRQAGEAGGLGFFTLVSAEDVDGAARSLRSLRAQTCPSWTLILLLDPNLSTAAIATLEAAREGDSRCHLVRQTERMQPAQAFSAAMERLQALLIAHLPAGDELASDAVASILNEADSHPDLAILVCDHDDLDAEGRRLSPSFKPDWNLDYLLCFNYVGPAVLFRRSAAEDAGGWQNRFPGLETYDLLLRIAAQVERETIVHLPRPIWHRHVSGNQPSILEPVRAFLDAQGQGVRAQVGPLPGTAKLVWPLPETPPHVTLIIPTRDRIDLLKTAVDSILEKTAYPRFDILVVDNGSVEPESLAYLAEVEATGRVSVLRDDGPFNFSRLNNRAAAVARGSVLALVNNDVEVEDGGWLAEMVAPALDPTIGAVGAKLLYGSGHVQHAGIIGGVGTVAGHGHKFEPRDAAGYMNRLVVQQTVTAVTGACLVVEAWKYNAVGGLDEANLVVAFNDVELCLKLAARGWRSLLVPSAVLYHHESLSRGLDLSGERAARFSREAAHMVSTWGDRILQDPFYSPNLTRQHEDFSLLLSH